MFVHLALTISISKIACGIYMIHESCSVEPTNKWSWQLRIALVCCHLPACLTMFLTAWYQTLTDAPNHQLECYLHPRKCRVQKECDRLLSTKRNKQFCNQSNVGHGAYQYLHIFTLNFSGYYDESIQNLHLNCPTSPSEMWHSSCSRGGTPTGLPVHFKKLTDSQVLLHSIPCSRTEVNPWTWHCLIENWCPMPTVPGFFACLEAPSPSSLNASSHERLPQLPRPKLIHINPSPEGSWPRIFNLHIQGFQNTTSHPQQLSSIIQYNLD